MSLPHLPPYPRPSLASTVHATLVARQSCVLYAPRGAGKTTFLQSDLLPVLNQAGWTVCTADLAATGDAGGAVVDVLERDARRGGVPLPHDLPGAARPSLVERLTSAADALVGSGPGQLLLVLEDADRLATSGGALARAFAPLLARHRRALKLLCTSSSWTPPDLWGAHPIALPELDDGFLAHRARLFEGMTTRAVDIEALGWVFERVGAFPAYLDRILLHMVAAQTSDPERGFVDWLSAAGTARLHPIWASLPALDRVVLEHLALPACGDGDQVALFGAAFASLASRQPGVGPVSPAKIQTAVKRLIRGGLVAPLGEPGAYVIQDPALALHIHRLHRAGRCSCSHEHTGSLWDA